MSTNIKITDQNTYLINDKEVLIDSDGRIYSREELTPTETKSLLNFIKAQKSETNQES